MNKAGATRVRPAHRYAYRHLRHAVDGARGKALAGRGCTKITWRYLQNPEGDVYNWMSGGGIVVDGSYQAVSAGDRVSIALEKTAAVDQKALLCLGRSHDDSIKASFSDFCDARRPRSR